jgi:hypothetical protein
MTPPPTAQASFEALDADGDGRLGGAIRLEISAPVFGSLNGKRQYF